MRVSSVFAVPAILLAVALSACGDPISPRGVLQVQIASGNEQTDTVGQELPLPLGVRVTDSQGRQVFGLTVVFEVTSGGGSVAPETTSTSGTGVAQTRWTLGTSTQQSQRVAATVVDPRSDETVGQATFTATARADRPVGLEKRSGDGQSGSIGVPLNQQLVVALVDRYGNGVPGFAVQWIVDSAAGTVSPTNAATDNSGLARAQWTLGLTLDTAKYRVTAVVVGVATDVVFTATPQLPTSLILEVLGDSQYGIAGERLVESVGLRVGVQLSGGWFPIRNVVVSFAVTEGNGTITPPQLRTNDYGEARASWVLGPEEGTNRGTIAVATRTVALTAVAVQPSFVVYNDSQVAFAGTGLAESLLVLLQVPTRWGGNVGVPGQAVSFAVTSGAGVITPSQVTTDGGGWARASWVLGTAPGSNTATATFRSVAVSLTAEGFQPIAVNAIATGSAHSCAVTVTGTTYCWGDNRTGQLGDGGITRQPRPVAVVGGPALVAIAAGSQHTCGVDAGGLVYCWGDNTAGQLGDGTLISRLVPTAVSGGPPLVSLTLGRLHSCGLTSAGSAYCWGDNTFGQVGDSSTTARLGPTAVAGGRVFTRLSAGDDHTCGLEPGGGIYCWGVNNLGQLGATTSERCTYRTPGGIGSATCSTAPARVSTALSFTDLTSRNAHACGLTSGGAVYCWGQGDVGLEFVQSDAPPFSRLANGTTCALTAAGDAYCWDVYLDEYYGYRYITWPSRVGGAVGFSLVVGREGHSCAQSAGVQAYAYCWGYNADGQLGDGTVRSRYVPGPVWLVGP